MPLAWLVVLATSIPVEIAGEPSCDLSAEVPAAVDALLGEVDDEGLSVRIDVGSEATELRLSSADGVVLFRRLPAEETACPAVPDTVALILERFFRDLGWTPGAPKLPPPPAPLPDVPAQPRVGPGPVIAPVATADPVASDAPPAQNEPAGPKPAEPEPKPKTEPKPEPEPEPPAAPRFESLPEDEPKESELVAPEEASEPIEFGLAFSADFLPASGLPFRVELGGAARFELLVDKLRFSVGGGAGHLGEQSILRQGFDLGTVGAYEAFGELGFGNCALDLGTLRFCGHIGVGIAAVSSVTNSEFIFRGGDQTVAAPRGSLTTMIEWPMLAGDRLTVRTDLGFIWRPTGPSFVVAGADGEDEGQNAFTTPNLSVFLGLGVRTKIF